MLRPRELFLLAVALVAVGIAQLPSASAVLIDDSRGDVALSTDSGDVPLNPQGSQLDHMDLLQVEFAVTAPGQLRVGFRTAAIEAPPGLQLYGDITAEFIVRGTVFRTDWDTPDCPEQLDLSASASGDPFVNRGCIPFHTDQANLTRHAEIPLSLLQLAGGGDVRGGDVLERFYFDIGQNYTGTSGGLASLAPGSRFRDRAPDAGFAEAVMIPEGYVAPAAPMPLNSTEVAAGSSSPIPEETPSLPLFWVLAAVLALWARVGRRRAAEGKR